MVRSKIGEVMFVACGRGGLVGISVDSPARLKYLLGVSRRRTGQSTITRACRGYASCVTSSQL